MKKLSQQILITSITDYGTGESLGSTLVVSLFLILVLLPLLRIFKKYLFILNVKIKFKIRGKIN
jgi:hypothetical protein